MERIRNLICRERAFQALALAVAGYLLIGALRPRDITGLSPDAFWKVKMGMRAAADLVIAGDSRTYSGLSPAVMTSSLPGTRILNFGFDNAGFSEAYVEAVEKVLDPRAHDPVIVLGITPHSLTPGTGGRFTARSRGLSRRRMVFRDPRSGAWFARLTERVALDQALLFLTGSPRFPRHDRCYYPDGWMASRLTPEQPENGFAVARGWYEGNRFAPDMAQGVIRRVGAWTARGIRVYGFRPPTDSLLARLEDELSGFPEDAFIRDFTAAGGLWLTIPDAPYHTYDSSHLDRDSAVRLSREIAGMLSGRREGLVGRVP